MKENNYKACMLITYNTKFKIQIQGNCKDHWRDNDFILLKSIINETNKRSEIIEAYNKCFQRDITEPVIELDLVGVLLFKCIYHISSTLQKIHPFF